MLIDESKQFQKKVGGFTHDSRYPTHENFPLYCLWRSSKCPDRPRSNDLAVLDEMDQATHEFVGECAEVAQAVYRANVEDLYYNNDSIARANLIDEIGDVIFCGCWCADAWGVSPMREYDSRPTRFVPLIRDMRKITWDVRNDRRWDWDFYGSVASNMAVFTSKACMFSGLISNSFKKHKWQGRAQDSSIQANRIVSAFNAVSELLEMVGSNVEEAMLANITKLDARFPYGYQAGGGIRTGKGK